MSLYAISEESNKRFLNPERAALFIPIITGFFLSLLAFFMILLPSVERMNKSYFELTEYIRKRDELSKLGEQYKLINLKYRSLQSEKENLIVLLAGNNTLETFLSEIQSICSNNLIKIINLQPQDIEKFNSSMQSQPSDPFLSKGIEKYTAILTLKAPFQNILEFVRDLELVENIVITKEFSFESDNSNYLDDIGDLTVKFKILAYGRDITTSDKI